MLFKMIGLITIDWIRGSIWFGIPGMPTDCAKLRMLEIVHTLPTAPDVALVMLAAPQVPAAVRACAERGIAAVVVLSSGFEETDDGHAYASALE